MSERSSERQIKWVPLGACEVIYRDAQRGGVNERTVNDIMSAFDPHALGIPFVGQVNGDSHYHIIDGQNRITALKRMGFSDDTLIEVEVIRVASKAEAARLFVLRNTFRAPSAVDRFIASVAAGFPKEVAVDEMVRSLGFKVAAFSNDTTISAVTALVRAYDKYGDEAVRAALATISATWRSDGDRTRGEIIEAWAKLFYAYGDIVDAKRLASRVGKKYTAGNLIAAARANRDMFGGTVMENVLRATVVQYNNGLRTSARIPLE